MKIEHTKILEIVESYICERDEYARSNNDYCHGFYNGGQEIANHILDDIKKLVELESPDDDRCKCGKYKKIEQEVCEECL